MFKISITHTGIDEAKAIADTFHEAYRRKVKEALQWFGQVTSDEMRADHPYEDRTGWLTASTGFSTNFPQTGLMTVTVFALAAYAQSVEAGTPRSRPYPFFWVKFYKFLPELMAKVQTALQEAHTETMAAYRDIRRQARS